MDPARQIKARFEGIFQSLSETVLFSDQRVEALDQPLMGYLTRGSGPDAGEEFRFLEPVAGLLPGSLLRLASKPERWRVEDLAEERMDGELLFVAARVRRLDGDSAPPDASLQGILASLQGLLAGSTLTSLEAEDAREALARLPQLCGAPADPEHAHRIKVRLRLLKDRFHGCPQTAHTALGLLLKLEVQLKRQGMP